MPASSPAPATILWNRSAEMPPEQEKVKSAPPGRSSRKREPVDVLVGARRALGVRRGRRQLRRIENDRVEALLRIEQSAQSLVDIGIARLVARRIEAVQRHVRRRPRERRSGRIDADDVSCAAGERGDAEAAGVAIAVEDAREAEVANGLGEELAVVALVEIEAGLVAAWRRRDRSASRARGSSAPSARRRRHRPDAASPSPAPALRAAAPRCRCARRDASCRSPAARRRR